MYTRPIMPSPMLVQRVDYPEHERVCKWWQQEESVSAGAQLAKASPVILRRVPVWPFDAPLLAERVAAGPTVNAAIRIIDALGILDEPSLLPTVLRTACLSKDLSWCVRAPGMHACCTVRARCWPNATPR